MAEKLDYFVDGQALKVRVYERGGENVASFTGLEIAPGRILDLETVSALAQAFDEIARIMRSPGQ